MQEKQSIYSQEKDTSIADDEAQVVIEIENSLNKNITITDEDKEWGDNMGINNESHLKLHAALRFIYPNLGNDADKLRKLFCTSVVQVTNLNASRILLRPRPKPKPNPDKEKNTPAPSVKIRMQGIENKILKDVINLPFHATNLVPSRREILASISDTTRENILELSRVLKDRKIAFIHGPTGLGKTTLAKTLAFHLGVPLYQETGSLSKTYVQLTRKIEFRNTKSGRETITVPSGLIKAAMTGAIYLIDEFNYLPGDVQLAIAQIVDDGSILLENDVRVLVHPDFAIIATGNIGYGGTNKVNDAVIRRAGGGQEVDYLPEEEEAEAIYVDVLSKIESLRTLRGIDLNQNLLIKDQVLDVVRFIGELRTETRNSYNYKTKRKRINLSQLPVMEDGVPYYEQFSFRAVSSFIYSLFVKALSQGKRTINYNESFYIFSQPTNDKESLKNIFNRKLMGKQFQLNDSIVVTVNIEERTAEELERELDSLFSSEFSSVSLLGEKDANVDNNETDVANNETDKFELDPTSLVHQDFDPMEEFILETPSQEATEIGEPLILDEKAQKYIKKLYEECLGLSRNEEGEPVYLEKRFASILDFKNILTFKYEDIKAYALLAWKGIIKEASFYNTKSGEFFIPNDKRINSYIQVYFEDSKGKIFINPAEGKIYTESQLGEEISDEYIRVSISTDDSKKHIKSLIISKIKDSLIHAKVNTDQTEGNGMRTISDVVYPSVEGATEIYKAYTPEDAGRYFDYKTPTVVKTLESIKHSHLTGKHVLLTGPSGTGKSSFAKTYAIDNGLPYISVQFHERISESDLIVKLEITNGQIVEVPRLFLNAFKFGWVAEIREINLAIPNFVAFLNTALDQNGTFTVNGEIIKKHPNFLLVATRNPYSELFPGTKPMASSLLNRFDSMTIDYASQKEEVDMLMNLIKEENEKLNETNSKALRGLLNKIHKSVSITRNHLKDETTMRRLSPEQIMILQRQRLSTDLLQDLVRNAKDLYDLANKFLNKIRLSEEENKLLPQGVNNTATLAEFLQYKSK